MPWSLEKSHPSRVRGLKLVLFVRMALRCCVAPFTGAWIEISLISSLLSKVLKSHPSRVRGLKFMVFIAPDAIGAPSHPSRVRGLKSSPTVEEIMVLEVAPFTGAWIEIKSTLL